MTFAEMRDTLTDVTAWIQTVITERDHAEAALARLNMAAEVDNERARMVDERNGQLVKQLAEGAVRLTALEAENAKLRDDAEYWQLVSEGIKHSHQCPNNAAAGNPEGMPPCDRCRAEQAEADLAACVSQVTALEVENEKLKVERDSLDDHYELHRNRAVNWAIDAERQRLRAQHAQIALIHLNWEGLRESGALKLLDGFGCEGYVRIINEALAAIRSETP